jgi:hypothetical protein
VKPPPVEKVVEVEEDDRYVVEVSQSIRALPGGLPGLGRRR